MGDWQVDARIPRSLVGGSLEDAHELMVWLTVTGLFFSRFAQRE